MRVGVIGAGGMGRVHTSKYPHVPGVELYVQDRNIEHSENLANQFGGQMVETVEELLETVDIIDVCLPTHMHAEISMRCMKAGKHVICEKPLAGSLEECDQMIACASECGVKLMPAQVVRWFPEHKAAHEAIAAGQIGKPASIRMRRGGNAPTGSSEWFTNLEVSGGVLLDVAVHDFDWALWTVGPVESVYARSIRYNGAVSDDSFKGDYACATLTHANGCISLVEATWMDPHGFHAGLEAAGSEGCMEFFSRDDAGIELRQEATPLIQERPGIVADDPYLGELAAFVDSVRNNTELPVTALEGKAAVAVALAALESAKTGQAVRI
jgi:predicted dehydrogenase